MANLGDGDDEEETALDEALELEELAADSVEFQEMSRRETQLQKGLERAMKECEHKQQLINSLFERLAQANVDASDLQSESIQIKQEGQKRKRVLDSDDEGDDGTSAAAGGAVPPPPPPSNPPPSNPPPSKPPPPPPGSPPSSSLPPKKRRAADDSPSGGSASGGGASGGAARQVAKQCAICGHFVTSWKVKKGSRETLIVCGPCWDQTVLT